IERGASRAEVKKAYHKAALSSHPDKVPENERADAETKFKLVGKAYEILYNDEKRHLYDTHGMSAFEASQGPGPSSGVDLEEMLAQMFGMGGSTDGFGGAGPYPQKPLRGKDEVHSYHVTLEHLYKGKVARFSSKKNVICRHCKGTGGKEKSKPMQCGACQGKGVRQGLKSVGPGLVTQETVVCSACKGTKSVYKDKDKCRKCKGERVTEEKKALEIFIPPGSNQGDKIVLEGEADQEPDQEPGNIIFNLIQLEHKELRRAGADLSADVHISLAEALCGFSRVLLKHLDGRGIRINHPRAVRKVLKPGSVIKVGGEGMPKKKSEAKGDLYLVIQIDFPENGWLEQNQRATKLQEILPKQADTIHADVVDEVEYDESATLSTFGMNSEDQDGWEDDDDDDNGNATEAQCTQQ
ncbi:MAG: hypothetical protein Q9214_005173, partial [Letrouitia sp. 1 TL-2023]